MNSLEKGVVIVWGVLMTVGILMLMWLLVRDIMDDCREFMAQRQYRKKWERKV